MAIPDWILILAFIALLAFAAGGLWRGRKIKLSKDYLERGWE